MAYVYRGKIHDVGTTTPLDTLAVQNYPATVPAVFDPTKCGTAYGYKLHDATNTAKCQPCKDANAAYSRDYEARLKTGQVRRGFNPDACGTNRGWHRHKRHDVQACDGCESAHADYMRDYYQARKAAA